MGVRLQPTPDSYTRNVTEAEAWAREHQPTLLRVYRAFDETGEWPKAETLQRDLNRRGDTHDLISELRGMPPSLGVLQHEGRVALNIRGLAALPESEPLLSAYMAVIKLAVDRYRGEEEEPQITDGDLRCELGMDKELTKRVGVLVFGEGWPFGSGGGEADGSWYREVPVELRHLIGADDVRDFLEIQAKLRYGPPAPPHESQPESASTSQTTPVSEVQVGAVRGAEPRSLSPKIFRQLVFRELAKLKDENYFVEGFEEGGHMTMTRNSETIPQPPRVEDPEAWLMLNLNTEDLWPQLSNPSSLADSSASNTKFEDRDLLLRTLELLHRDVVSRPVFDSDGTFEGFYDRPAGQARLREAIAPLLERLEPPLEMQSDGEIVPAAPAGLHELGDRPLPDSESGDEFRARVQDAVRRFRNRAASDNDQIAAITSLAGILENLEKSGRLALDGQDESDLFNIANNFAIRHDRPGQKRDYGPAHREWIFYAYLAAIRLSVRVIDGDNSD